MEMCTKCFGCDVPVGSTVSTVNRQKKFKGFHFKTIPGDTQFHKPYQQLKAFCKSIFSNHEGEHGFIIKDLNSVYS